jgi:hypothetical protein
MRYFSKRHLAQAAILAVLGWSSAASAYTPQWLECTGDVTVTPIGGAAAKQAAKDIYVFDPDARNLFRYFEDRKQLSYLGAKTGKTEQDIRWSGSSSGIDMSEWEGQFDRSTLALHLTYKTNAETRMWAEQCTPTAPRPEGS